MSISSACASRGAAAAFLVLTSAPALADEPLNEPHAGLEHNQIHGVRMDVHADLGNYGAFGVGVRGDIPIVANGLIDGVNDELAISPGVEVFFVNSFPDRYDGGPYVMPLAMLQWNFYLGDSWSVFPEAGVALFVGDRDFLPRDRGVYAAVATGVGARYHFNGRNALLMRASWPAGLQVGMTF